MKGQVSFFIIIGVLAIIGVVAGLLIFSAPPSQPPTPHDYSPDFIALRSCSDAEFADAIVLAGLNGGILEMSPEQRSKGAYFEPFTGYEFPLWNKNSLLYIPSKSDMEKQIGNELRSRIVNRCIVESGIDPRTTAMVSVTLSERRNTAEISFDGEFVSDDARRSIPGMRIENDIPLLSVFNAAQRIANHLLSSGMLVGMNHNIIELSPDIPTSGSDFSCSTKHWRKSEVQNSFMQSLETYIPYIRFDNNPSVSGDIARKHFTFSVPSAIDNNIIVRANYQGSFGMVFEAEKSQGDMMTSLVTMNPETPGICQNHYSFWYSMQYPIVFTIEDRSSPVPFQFRMALYNEVFRNQLEEAPAQQSQSGGYCSDTTYRRARIILQDDKGAAILNAFGRIRCGDEECVIRTDSEGVVNDYLPRRCIRGTATFEKAGYETVTTSYSANAFDDFNNRVVTMPKLREISLHFIGNDYDLSEFIFMVESGGKWITFDNNKALVPRNEMGVKFTAIKLDETNNLVPVYGPTILRDEDNLIIKIRVEHLAEKSYNSAFAFEVAP
jgi:hypothetical protein